MSYQTLQHPKREDSPVLGSTELLDNRDHQYLNNFFNSLYPPKDVTNMATVEGLGGVYTADWMMPPANVVAHQVTLGEPDDNMFTKMFGIVDFAGQPNLEEAGTSNLQEPLQESLQQPRRLQNFGHTSLGATHSTLQQHQPQGSTNIGFGFSTSVATPRFPRGFFDAPPTPDDVAAAATLVGGNTGPYSMSLFPDHQALALETHTSPTSQTQPGHIQPEQLRSTQQSTQQTLQQRRYNEPIDTGLFGQHFKESQPSPFDVRFGSDPNFTTSNFVPASANETTEALAAGQLAYLNCLEPNHSAGPTRAASPTAWAPPSPSMAAGNSLLVLNRRRTIPHIPPTPEEPPARRRKTSKTGALAMAASPTTPEPPRRRSTATTINSGLGHGIPATIPELSGGESASAAAPSRRPRKSGGGNAGAGKRGARKKSPRTVLTEEQRRLNHVDSEKKRRQLIKGGYGRLAALVPELTMNALSRSDGLCRMVDWIEKAQEGNRELERLLSFAVERNGGDVAAARSAAG
ncbi:uncharacterized protein B0H64DRAFT_392887 [Chaetomium fimeti]|uniref:BHLH domain-containing protein n=1 Tax=Chaetomium fimeti TaxID=1854472 RepID=A0AAE0LTZ7_9PEZI|nr:hypothetical protein B0H64DRAFT_392887 [Chaetomium fimeti]